MLDTPASSLEWIKPDRNLPDSLQVQITRWLERLIISGKLAPGARLPAEAVLVDRLGVSRVTVRLAVDDLVARSLVTRTHGKGSYVSTTLMRQDLSSEQGFFDALLSNANDPEARLLSFDIIVPPPVLVQRFGLAPGDVLPRIERLYLSAGRPIAFSSGWLAADGASLTRSDVASRSTATIHRTLLKRPVVTSTIRIGAQLAGSVAAKRLDIRARDAVLLLSRTRFDANGLVRDETRFTINPVAYELILPLGDRGGFAATLQK